MRMSVPQVVVPIARLDRSTLGGLAYARSISLDVTAVHVTDDPATADAIRQHWKERTDGISLVIIESAAAIAALLGYLDEREQADPERQVVVVVSQFVPRRIWTSALHDQTAVRLKLRLLFRPNTVVVDVPYRV